jgi:acetate kinase
VRVLVCNAGSSSLKLSVVDDGRRDAERTVERWDGTELPDGLDREVDAVAHRFVHGGRREQGCVLADDVLAELEHLTPLAPLHQPRALAVARQARQLLPDVPQVACFDTAFHAHLPAAAATYALPRDWIARWELRRVGFHGLSHGYAAQRGAQLAGLDLAASRFVTCHLGAGASLCAVVGGRSVDTTMGFTPLAGLVMATRAGDVDPGLLLWLQDQGISPAELGDALERRSGLAGLSGTSGDLRDVLAARSTGDPDAGLAYDVLVHRLRQSVAAMVASCGGLDLLVLTGGMAEHSAVLREDLLSGLAWCGVGPAVDGAGEDRLVSGPGSAVAVAVVKAGEDLHMAREAEALLGA